MSAPLLSISDLSVSYALGERRARAVDGLSLTLEAGQRLGIVGESGSGKSTLALALMRLHKPPAIIESGQIVLGSTDILKLDRAALRAFRWSEIALIPQGAMNSLNPVIRVHAQMADTIRTHRSDLSGREIDKRIDEMLGRVGLSPSVARLYPHELSGGMKQRVCIALAIVLEPKLIIADEPTSALDVVVQRVVIETLKQVQADIGAAMIMIGHDMGLMAQSVDHLGVMYAGRLVDIAPIRDFFHKPLHPYSQLLISSLPSPDETRPLAGIPYAAVAARSARRLRSPALPRRQPICRLAIPPLETVAPGRRAACHVVSAEAKHVHA